MRYLIVTGEPRSGTSLMMTVLKALGVKIWGMEIPHEHWSVAERKKPFEPKTEAQRLTAEEELKRRRSLNTEFYEIPGVVVSGLRYSDLVNQRIVLDETPMEPGLRAARIEWIERFMREYEEMDGAAVKVITSGMPRTDAEILNQSKIVWCLRTPWHVAYSQTNLRVQDFQVIGEAEAGQFWDSPRNEFTPYRYLAGILSMLTLIHKRHDLESSVITVDYDDMVFHSEDSIRNLVQFLGLSESGIEAALKMIDVTKRRSQNPPAPQEDFGAWRVAHEAYLLIRQHEFEVAYRLVSGFMQEKAEEWKRENTPFLDTEDFIWHTATWWNLMGGRTLLEIMAEDGKVEKKMLEITRQRERQGELAKSCPHFNRRGEEYETPMPAELGGKMIRRGVACPIMGNVTLERCQAHWENDQMPKTAEVAKRFDYCI